MTPSDTPDHSSAGSAEALRAWAKGAYSSEAATELLVRAFGGRFAQQHRPWIHEESGGYAWIESRRFPTTSGPSPVVSNES